MDIDPTPILTDETGLTALRRLQLLDSTPEESFDRVTRLATYVLRAPVALVSLLDERRQFFIGGCAAVGAPRPVRARPPRHPLSRRLAAVIAFLLPYVLRMLTMFCIPILAKT